MNYDIIICLRFRCNESFYCGIYSDYVVPDISDMIKTLPM